MNNIPISINLSFQQLLDAVKKLPAAEKSLLNEAIWDDNMAIPQEHQSIVLDRVAKAKKNPDRLVDWDKASKNL
jgi:hypothetical protein